MLNWPATVRVFVCTVPTDMRKQFDGLHALITPTFGRDVLEGHLFLFFNRRRTQVKLLYWEPGGLALWTKRLEAGRYEMPARDAGQGGLEVDAVELSLILGGVDLRSVKRRRRYDRPARNAAVAAPEKSS